MPLTTRTNGSGGSNIIQAAWFNDFLNLLTGVMQDQEVTIKNVLILQAIGPAPTAAPAATPTAGTTLGIGLYAYVYTYANADGETTISPAGTMTTTSSSQAAGSLTGITVGPTGTTKRNLYRTPVGGGTNYKFVVAINDNTTTTYTDTLADGSLGAAPPSVPSFGGALIIKDSTGAVKFKINNDGSFSAGGSTGFGNTTINGTLTVTGTSSLDNAKITTDGSGNITKVGAITNSIAPITVSGSTSGTVTAYMDFRGSTKRVILFWNNFKNGATTTPLILPVAFSSGAHVSSGEGVGFNVNLSGGANLTILEQTGFQTSTSQVNIDHWVLVDINGGFDRIVPTINNTNSHTGWTTIEGN